MLNKLLKKAVGPFIGKGYGRHFPLVAKLYGRLISGKVVECKVGGLTMHANLRDRIVSQELFFKGIFEPELTAVVQRLVLSDTVFVDVGAHIGYYTLIASSRAKKGMVYAFEPQNDNFALLRRNVAANRLENVKLFNLAVADRSGRRIKLYCNTSNMGNNSIYSKDIVSDYVEQEARTVTLDDALKSVRRVDIVKIDVEGAEMDVLRGMRRLLRRSPKVTLLVEYVPSFYERPRALVEFLRKERFEIMVIGQGRHGKLQKLDSRTLADAIKISRTNPAFNLNFLCRRKAG